MENRRMFEHANRSIAVLGILTGLPVQFLTEAEYCQLERQTASLTWDDLNMEGRR